MDREVAVRRFQMLLERNEVTTTGTYEVIGVIGDSPYANQRAVRTTANNQYITFPSVTPTNDFSLTLWVMFPLTTTSEGWRTLWEKAGGDDHHVIDDAADETDDAADPIDRSPLAPPGHPDTQC